MRGSWFAGGRGAWLQAISGAYLGLFLAVHVGAVLYGRHVLHLDTNFYFAAAGLHVHPFERFFAPYYFLAVLALFAHVGCAFYWWLEALHPAWSRVLPGTALIAGAVASLLITLSLAGLLEPVDVPVQYKSTFSARPQVAVRVLRGSCRCALGFQTAPRPLDPTKARLSPGLVGGGCLTGCLPGWLGTGAWAVASPRLGRHTRRFAGNLELVRPRYQGSLRDGSGRRRG